LKKEGSVKRRKVVVEPTRRSGRVRAMEIDEEEGKKRKYVYVHPKSDMMLMAVRTTEMSRLLREDHCCLNKKL